MTETTADREARLEAERLARWWARVRQLAAAEMENALREGRHSAGGQFVCGGCGEFVESIWYTTPDRKRLCPKCAPPDRRKLTLAEIDKLRAPEDRGKPF